MKAWTTKSVDDGELDLYNVTNQQFLAEFHAKRWNAKYAGKVGALGGHVASKKKAVQVEITEISDKE